MVFFYLLRILIFFASSQSFFFWMAMEFNLLSFLFLVYNTNYGNLKDMGNVYFYYFLMQSLGRVLFLCSLQCKHLFSLHRDIIFFISLRLKLGIFPIFFWILYLGSSLGLFILFLIVTFQKIPILIILFLINYDILMRILLFSYLFGSFFIFFSSNLNLVLICSSISSTFWVYILFLNNLNIYFTFFCFYTSIFLRVMFFKHSFKENKSSIIIVSLFLFLSGFPPFSLFFFKFYLSRWVFFEISFLNFVLFWIFGFFCLLSYIKFFYFNFFFNKFLYLKHNFCFKKISFLVISGLFFFPYVV